VQLQTPDPVDVDAVIDRGCVGLSLPAGALADPDGLERVGPLLARLATEIAARPALWSRYVEHDPGPPHLQAAAARRAPRRMAALLVP